MLACSHYWNVSKQTTRQHGKSEGSSNTDVLDSPCLLVLITGTSQSRQHGKSEGSSNTDVLDSPCLPVLITRTSQSRQHGKSKSDSYYLFD
nr:hypothetical protein [Tanacetum cinerariifolium]